MQLARYIFEVDYGVNVEYGFCLFGLYVLVNIFLKTFHEFGHILPFQCQTGSVSVPSKVYQQVAAAFMAE